MMKSKHGWMICAICLGAFMSHFTAGVVNVSLPQFMKQFHAGLGEVAWITTGYLLVITAMLPIMGKLGDRYGYRLIHNLGYVIFTIGSILVAISPDLVTMILLRIVQALGASMFQATNIALITIHLNKEKRGWSLGIVSTAVALGAMTGPIAGGMIAEWLSWQWLFLIHVPIAFVATMMAYRFIPVRSHTYAGGNLDRLGAGFFVIAISLIIYTILTGNKWGWISPAFFSFLGIIVFILVILTIYERRQSHPFLPLQALQTPLIAGGLLISCSSFLLANSVIVVMPFYLLGMPEFSPLSSGYVLTAYPISLAIAGPIAGHLSDRYGSKRLMYLGLSCMGLGFIMFSLTIDLIPVIGIVALLALIGLGMGLIAAPNNSFIMRHTPADQVGAIGGMIALSRNAGMVFGSALGLGLISGEIGQSDQAVAMKSVFIIDLALCIAAIIILYVMSRRGRVTPISEK